MQFHTRTLLMVLATFAVVLTLTSAGGAWVQTAALVSVAVAWVGVLIAALVCDASQPRVGRDIFLLTLGFFLVVLGGMSACFCVGLSAKRLFHDSAPLACRPRDARLGPVPKESL